MTQVNKVCLIKQQTVNSASEFMSREEIELINFKMLLFSNLNPSFLHQLLEHCPLGSLCFSWSHIPDLVWIPSCNLRRQPAACAGVQGRGQWWEHQLFLLHKGDPWTSGGRAEGKVEGAECWDGLRETGQEPDGVGHGVNCWWTQRDITIKNKLN